MKYYFSDGIINETIEEKNEKEAWNALYWMYRDISKFEIIRDSGGAEIKNMTDDNLIEGIFTADFCEQLWKRNHPRVPYRKNSINVAEARLKSWEMLRT